jgi:hypothetical protein
MTLGKFNVTVKCFDPTSDLDKGETFVLPVDSLDPEHAVSAAMSNAVAFTQKLQGQNPLPIAFQYVAMCERPATSDQEFTDQIKLASAEAKISVETR